MDKKIYLVRHAESEHNAVNNGFSGISDINISDLGRRQAHVVGTLFSDMNIDEVYCSTLVRAKQTAKIIFEESKEIQYIDGLKEMDFGDYEGRYFDPNNYDDNIFELWMNNPSKLEFPNGSNVEKHGELIYKTMENIVASSKAESLVIVSHSTTLRIFIAKVLGLHLDFFRRIPCDNCSVTTLIYNNGFSLKECNYVHRGVRYGVD